MRRRLLAITALLVGCGGAPAGPPPSPRASAAGAGAEVPSAGAAEPDDGIRAERIRELESHLALRSAEVRELRDELSETRDRLEDARARRDAVRIGERRGRTTDTDAATGVDAIAEVELGEPPGDVVADAEPHDDDEGERSPRPVLRLYGPPPRPALAAGVAPMPGSSPPPILPPPPPSSLATLGRLPVMATPDVPAIPDVPVAVAPPPPRAPLAVAPRASEDDPIARRYQAALAHVEARRWDDALAGFTAFADAHPSHPYADNALFWQGEILFARREYRRAVEILEALLVRYPHGNKVPDALLRIGVSYERLGDPERARAYFRRVREQFPDSVAARQASREET